MTNPLKSSRAYVRQPSGFHLNLLDPDPQHWTNADLAISLSRTYRWGGHSLWDLPLSVAQHSLTVIALYQQLIPTPLTSMQKLREALHDGEEGLMGGFDPISPLKPFLGPEFAALTQRLQNAISTRYKLAHWTEDEYRHHKHADTLAAACEAVYVVGWSPTEVRDVLDIQLTPLTWDPLCAIYGGNPWEPWPSDIAAKRFLAILDSVSS
jgi:hypothetical protein